MKDPKPSIRLPAALALWKVQGDARIVIPAVVSVLKEKDERLRLKALETLQKFGTEAISAGPELREGLRDPRGVVRVAAAGATWAVTHDHAVVTPVLAAALAEEEDSVRIQAGETLAEIGPRAKLALPATIDALQDPNVGVRLAAAHAVWRMDHNASAIVDVLIAAVKGRVKDLRLKGIEILEELGPAAKPALPELTKAQKGRRRGRPLSGGQGPGEDRALGSSAAVPEHRTILKLAGRTALFWYD